MTMRRALLVGVQVLACIGAATAPVRAQGAAPASVAAPRPALEPLRISGEVVVGNGGAPLTTTVPFGYTRVEQRPDGSILVSAVEQGSGRVFQSFAIHASGSPAP